MISINEIKQPFTKKKKKRMRAKKSNNMCDPIYFIFCACDTDNNIWLLFHKVY